MGTKTGIEWTDATWNPIRGCSRVSEGCRNCYAELMAARFSKPGQWGHGLTVLRNGKAQWTGKIEFVEKHLLDPLKWGTVLVLNPDCPENRIAGEHGHGNAKCICVQRSRRIFVNSVSDLFHENVTDDMRNKIFAVMALCQEHTFQVLTKRPEEMRAYFRGNSWAFVASRIGQIAGVKYADRLRALKESRGSQPLFPLLNVWLGVSVEDQKTADDRIPLLLDTPAALRFISAEPLLGPLRLDECAPYEYEQAPGNPGVMNAFNTSCFHPLTCVQAPKVKGTDDGIRWVICGGESGAIAREGLPVSRAMHPDWARSLRDQCVAAGVPFFFKQWGSWLPAMQDGGFDKSGARVLSCSDDPIYVVKHAAGPKLDGVEWKQFPEVAS